MRELPYNYEDIEKIMNFSSWSDKEKIDEMLRIDCNLYANMGKDSTKTDKENVKKMSRNIYRSIKTVDYSMGESFLQAMDK